MTDGAPLILFLNGPNLGRLGARKPELYGTTTLAELEAQAQATATKAGCRLVAFQSESEADLIRFIDRHRDAAGILVNPGALMMSGWALRDAIEDFGGTVVEVHLSNLWRREAFRHVSVLSPVVEGVIAGLGPAGYGLGLRHLLDRVVGRPLS